MTGGPCPCSPTSSAAGGLARSTNRYEQRGCGQRSAHSTTGRGATSGNISDRPKASLRIGVAAHSAKLRPSCAIDVVEDREAARDDPGEALAVGCILPVLTHRD